MCVSLAPHSDHTSSLQPCLHTYSHKLPSVSGDAVSGKHTTERVDDCQVVWCEVSIFQGLSKCLQRYVVAVSLGVGREQEKRGKGWGWRGMRRKGGEE